VSARWGAEAMPSDLWTCVQATGHGRSVVVAHLWLRPDGGLELSLSDADDTELVLALTLQAAADLYRALARELT
jgi:hypothetical protein